MGRPVDAAAMSIVGALAMVRIYLTMPRAGSSDNAPINSLRLSERSGV